MEDLLGGWPVLGLRLHALLNEVIDGLGAILWHIERPATSKNCGSQDKAEQKKEPVGP